MMDILDDVVWQQANDDFGHRFSFRVTPPSEQHLARGGIHSVMSRVSMGLFKSRSDLIRSIFYGNTAENTSEMMGLSEFYNTVNPNNAQNSVNVLNGGGKAYDNSSVYLICWGHRTVYLVRPDGQPDDANHGMAAVVPVDWRFAVRIANIDVKKRDVDLASMMSQMLMRPPQVAALPSPKEDDSTPSPSLFPAIYMNSDVWGIWKSQWEENPVFRGIPIRIADELRSDESQVE